MTRSTSDSSESSLFDEEIKDVSTQIDSVLAEQITVIDE